jgi:putative ABC transport system permease protein
MSRPLGFEVDRVVTADISLIGTRHAPRGARSTTYWDGLIDQLRAIPGAEGAAVANWVPLGTGGTGFIEIEGQDVPGAGAGYRVISEGYFSTLRVPLISGRDFAVTDDSTSPRGVVVNRAMAERYWPGENPLGRRVRATSMESRGGVPAPWLTVLGVVGNVRHWGYEAEFTPEMYVSYRQIPYATFTATAVVRGRMGIEPLVQAVRDRVRIVDPTVPADIEPLSARSDRLTADRRLTMSLLTVFGALALALAAVGVYAVLSFSVAQRTREMAVRSALGADQRQIVQLVLVAGAWVVGAGVIAGTAGALALARVMSAFLFEVSPRDPAVVLAAVVVIVAAGMLAAAVPAWRAARVEPMLALKGE